MTRAQRFAVLAAVLTTLYFVAYFAILPVPLLSEDTKNQILPVVSLGWVGVTGRVTTFADSLVVAGIIWGLFSRFIGMGAIYISRLPRSVPRIAVGKTLHGLYTS